MAAYAHDNSFYSRRAIVFVTIVVFHVLLGWALATGLARKVVEVIAPPIQTDIVEEVQKRDEPPPPPPPQMERPPVEVPPPEVSIDLPVETNTTAISDVTDKPVVRPPPPPPAPPKPTNVVAARPDLKRFPSSEDYYPAASKRLGEQGSIVLRVCVGPNGKLEGEPTVQESSGSARLDEGAVKLAKAGRYLPGSADGQPTTSCFSFRVKFELKG
jgi:protein TonB